MTGEFEGSLPLRSGIDIFLFMHDNGGTMIEIKKRDRGRVVQMLKILGEVEQAVLRGTPADVTLAGIFRHNRRFGSRDRRFYASAVFSAFRWRGWVGSLHGKGASACLYAMLLDADELTGSLLALAEIAECEPRMLRPLGALDIDEKVDAMKKMGLSLESQRYEMLAPEWVWGESLFASESDRRAWATSFQRKLPVWLRVDNNWHEQAQKLFVDEGLDAVQHATITSAYAVNKNISRAVIDSQTAAGVEIQDIASQAVGLVCAPEAGQNWWDACAGAGGKTLHLADIMGNSGSILATDSRSKLLRGLHNRLRRSNTDIISTEKMVVGGALPKKAPFDGVLVDAPCSGTGTWARNSDARWRIAPQFVEKCAAQQTRILEGVAPAVKDGGVLVYSVCSVLRTETIDMVSEILENLQEFELAEFVDPLTGNKTDGTLFIRPWENRSIGMYIARFVKTGVKGG